MKKKLITFIPLSVALILSSLTYNCVSNNEYDNPGPAPIGEFSNDPRGVLLAENKAVDPRAVTVPNNVIIHYQLENQKYDDLRLWVWAGKFDPKEYFEVKEKDDYGAIFKFSTAECGPHDEFGFLALRNEDWTSKTDDCILKYEKFTLNGDGDLEVWCYPEPDNTIAVFKTLQETMGGKILTANFTDWKTINVTTSDSPVGYRLYALTSQYYSYPEEKQDYHRKKFLIDDHKFEEGASTNFNIRFMNMPLASVVYRLEVDFKGAPDDQGNVKIRAKTKNVGTFKLYDSARFKKYYNYNGDDLGVTYTKTKSTFKLWAPTCAHVNLAIYNVGKSVIGEKQTLYKMNYMPGGVWSCEVPQDLDGKYYTYIAYNLNGENEVVDPYAKSAGLDGVRGMVLDFDRTNPEGWDKIPDVWDKQGEFDLKQPNDLSVYETHIRDVTIHETWNGSKKAGTYEALIEKGTTYTKDGKTVKTGFDHIEELGVNAVQILPFFDQLNEETDLDTTNNKVDAPYNWGYNPLNYNVPEGVYSSNPNDGAVRVKEIKQMVQAFANNKNHTRVIMDVVYNHVGSSSTSNFEKLMPKYYFRTNADGKLFNDSGCGNDFKTDAPMASKFIVDSVKWWASEYKIKGFRFDLMGLIDVNTMKKVKDAVYAIDPDNVCYGEGWPWTGEGYPNDGANTGAVYSRLYPSNDSPGILGGFSDTFRDNIRGNNAPGRGWINPDQYGVGDRAGAVADGIRGFHKGKGGNPYQTINYASCHDNFTLYDQLYITLGDGTIEPEYDVLTSAILSIQSAVAFSNGIAFFHGGEELLRSKIEADDMAPTKDPTYIEVYGKKISHNSYQSSDMTNAFNYANKISINYKGKDIDTSKYFDKYCELIAKRAEFESRHGYSGDVNNTAAWYCKNGYGAENDPNGSVGVGIWWKYNNTEYWMLYSGCMPCTLGFDASSRTNLIYNSLDGDDTYSISNNTISMSARQFLVFKLK